MMWNKNLFIGLLLLCTCFLHGQESSFSSLERLLQRQGMVDISLEDSTLIIDLRYATENNFTKTTLYDSLSIAYLHPVAAEKLIKAHRLLKEKHPDYRFLILDAARPLSVQKKMFEVVQHTPYAAYVANPSKTGLHNYGMAVDLTICDSEGNELDMGTPFDFFGAAAGIDREEDLISKGRLTRVQVNNRKLLRQVMVEAEFLTIRGEWWHFNAVTLMTAKSNYEIIE